MAITIQDSKSSGQGRKSSSTIRHDLPLTATEVTDLKRVLTEKFESHNDLILEFTGLTDCDTLGVQLLLCANKTAKARGSRFEVQGDVVELQLAAERIGLNFEEYFNHQA